MNDSLTNGDAVPDALYGGRLILHQFRRGHRAGTDAVLLAAAAGAEAGDHFIDAGAGSGAVGLGLAMRAPGATGVLLEADAGAADLAHRNIQANGFEDRLSTACVDLLDRQACRAAGLVGSASLVVSNPPFFSSGQVRLSPDPGKAAAHVMASRTAIDGRATWLRETIELLRPQGRLVIIHRPEALPLLLGVMANRLGGAVLRAIHPKPGEPAIRILLGGRRSSRGPLTILPGLILHEEDGRFSEEAAALHQGAAMVFWPKQSRPQRAGFDRTG